MRNLSFENKFCMQFYSLANQSHFRKNGFALRLALKQRHKGTRKWPVWFGQVENIVSFDKPKISVVQTGGTFHTKKISRNSASKNRMEEKVSGNSFQKFWSTSRGLLAQIIYILFIFSGCFPFFGNLEISDISFSMRHFYHYYMPVSHKDWGLRNSRL